MAEAVIDLQASNLFGLNANFKTQSSSTSEPRANAYALDESGNVSCQRNITDILNYSQTASYCGSDFVGDLGTFLTQFGDVQNSKLVTGISISMNAGQYATITVDGHNHAGARAHAAGLSVGYADVSDFLPHEATESFVAWNGFGVPDFGMSLGDDASPISATVNFSMNHIDQTGEDGTHLVGKNITPRCELTMEFSGIPTSTSVGLIETDLRANTNAMLTPYVDSIDSNDSNSSFDSFAFTCHANTALETA